MENKYKDACYSIHNGWLFLFATLKCLIKMNDSLPNYFYCDKCTIYYDKHIWQLYKNLGHGQLHAIPKLFIQRYLL